VRTPVTPRLPQILVLDGFGKESESNATSKALLGASNYEEVEGSRKKLLRLEMRAHLRNGEKPFSLPLPRQHTSLPGTFAVSPKCVDLPDLMQVVLKSCTRT